MPVASDVREALRAEVARRADFRCEYCLIREDDAAFAHQVDHVISRKHGGPTSAGNLAYACVICNRNKGSDIASADARTGEVVRFFDPRRDRWEDHFRVEGALITPISSIGTGTVRLLRMNVPERIAERRLLQVLGRYPVR